MSLVEEMQFMGGRLLVGLRREGADARRGIFESCLHVAEGLFDRGPKIC